MLIFGPSRWDEGHVVDTREPEDGAEVGLLEVQAPAGPPSLYKPPRAVTTNTFLPFNRPTGPASV